MIFMKVFFEISQNFQRIIKAWLSKIENLKLNWNLHLSWQSDSKGSETKKSAKFSNWVITVASVHRIG